MNRTQNIRSCAHCDTDMPYDREADTVTCPLCLTVYRIEPDGDVDEGHWRDLTQFIAQPATTERQQLARMLARQGDDFDNAKPERTILEGTVLDRRGHGGYDVHVTFHWNPDGSLKEWGME